MARFVLRWAAVLTILIVLAGCAGPQGAGSSTPIPVASPSSAAPAAAQVTLVRTGGLPAVNDRVVVDANGAWTATDAAGKQRTGQLTAQQRDRLTQLLASGQLAREAQPSQPARCIDALLYTLTVGTSAVSYVDCPDDNSRPETTAAIVALLTEAALR
jgi:hypothetical protein